jgi:hypothetical protein
MDLMNIAAALPGGYVAFMGLTVVLIKVFFPFFTKEQLKRQQLVRNH